MLPQRAGHDTKDNLALRQSGKLQTIMLSVLDISQVQRRTMHRNYQRALEETLDERCFRRPTWPL